MAISKGICIHIIIFQDYPKPGKQFLSKDDNYEMFRAYSKIDTV